MLSRSFYIDLSVIICTLCSWEAVKEVWLSIFPIVSQAHDRLRSHRDTTIDCATWTSTGNHPQMAKSTGEFSSFRYIIYCWINCWLLISQYIPWNSFVVQCIPHKSARFTKHHGEFSLSPSKNSGGSTMKSCHFRLPTWQLKWIRCEMSRLWTAVFFSWWSWCDSSPWKEGFHWFHYRLLVFALF